MFPLSSVCWNQIHKKIKIKKKLTVKSSCSFFSPVSRFCLYIIDSQRLLLLANELLRQFFFLKRDGRQMKWWDSCNFWMTPPWQRQSPSIVLSHYSLLLCQGAFCIFCWFLCWTPCLQVRAEPQELIYFHICLDKTTHQVRSKCFNMPLLFYSFSSSFLHYYKLRG